MKRIATIRYVVRTVEAMSINLVIVGMSLVMIRRNTNASTVKKGKGSKWSFIIMV